MKCKNCGAELVEGVRFCSNCGAAVGKSAEEEIKVSSDQLVAEVKRLLHEGNVTKLIVKDERGKVLLEIPAWVGVVGAGGLYWDIPYPAAATAPIATAAPAYLTYLRLLIFSWLNNFHFHRLF